MDENNLHMKLSAWHAHFSSPSQTP